MKRLFLSLIAVLIAGFFPVPASPHAGGPVKGATFFYLDGVNEDFPWVLAHQYDPAVRAKIDALLVQYRNAGVNWIRLLVAYNFFSAGDVEPVPSAALMKRVNDFMAITRYGANAGKFRIELVLTTRRDSHDLYTDVAPYSHDKRWLEAWISQLDYANLGMIMLGGDLSPCYLSGCYGDPAPVEAVPMNHGAWIKAIWAWKQSREPNLLASYEVIGVQSLSNNDPALIHKLAIWMNANTPTNPVVAASIYVSLPAGSTAQSYAKATGAILDSYAFASGKALWIDEYGKSVGMQWLAPDQRAAYQGFLAASVCQHPNIYAQFAWVAGRDYPYKNGEWFGLVNSFDGTAAVMSAAWSDLAHYYNLETCP